MVTAEGAERAWPWPVKTVLLLLYPQPEGEGKAQVCLVCSLPLAICSVRFVP